MPIWSRAHLVCASSFVLVLAACSNGRGSVDSAPAEPQNQFSVIASVSGLEGAGLVLQNNGGDDLEIASSGAAEFATRLADGAAYDVSVLTQPTDPEQTCTVSDGSGTIAGDDAIVTVTCETLAGEARIVGGTVSGLTGSGLVLQNNSGDELAIDADGEFAFATPLESGAQYAVTVLTQPQNPAQTCSIANATGIVGDADVTNVAVSCSTESFELGGRVSGLAGSGLVLENNGVSLAIEGNGPFAFPERLASGTPYNVTVATQPSNPRQSCAIENATGTLEAANVANITVTCSTNRFTLGGTITGLSGSGLVLETPGGGRFEATMSGAFTFPNAVPSGTAYLVRVTSQPTSPSQTCAVDNASGSVGDANVEDIAVTCTTNRYTIGGRVSGLDGTGLTLRVNGRNDLAIASNGNFIFDTVLPSGTAYEVTVATQPRDPAQTCTVAAGTGTLGSSNVNSVRVTCATQTFSLSGTVSGLVGSGLVLQNNGQDPVEIETNGNFSFPRELASGAAYNVTVRTQPSNPVQSCTVANNTGVIGTADITNIAVTCSTSTFSVGGTVSGLSGSGLVLRNNGTDDLAVDANGTFTFDTPLARGGTYNVTVASQPTSPTQVCTVSNGSGTIAGANITNVAVSCATTEVTIGGTVSGLAGSGLALQNNGGPPLAIAANGPFTFPASVPTGSPYNVTVATQPQDPAQTCSVSGDAGTASSNVTSVSVTCTTASFTVGGTISGVTGALGVVLLQNNGGDTLVLSNDGPFTFATSVPSGSTFNVTIAAQPIGRSCTVSNGSGTIGNANVTNVGVECVE